MSRTVDERVVSMQFDNRNFENNVKTSMSTLDKLKNALDLKGSSKGFEKLSSAASKVSFDPIAKSAEAVAVKFSHTQATIQHQIDRLVDSAVNAGTRITKALTIDPVTSGFQEYETQINAVQTILANTQKEGTNVETVNAALDELNKYADQTIYNFTEMTRNIGTFTAAGVKLDDSVTAIKGIANLAAVSGSNSQQASTAMYQLSQALAAGKVSLMDWNSVVNAGMGGQVFQDALVRTSERLGTNAKDMIEKYGSFRESITKGEWMTAEVLTETLTQLSGAYTEADLIAQGYSKSQAKEMRDLADMALGAATNVKTFTQMWDVMKEAAQSGWGQTWRMIVGDFEEAKTLFTDLSNTFTGVINKMSDNRNNFLAPAINSKWDTMISKVEEAGIKTDDFQKVLKQTAKEKGINVDALTKKYGSLAKAFQAGKISGSVIIDTLKKFAGTSDKTTVSVKNLKKVVDQVINGDFGNGEARVKALTKAGYHYRTVQDLVNKTLKGEKINYDKLSDAQLKNMGYTKDQIATIRKLAEEAEKSGTSMNELINSLDKPSGRALLIDSIKNTLTAIGKLLSTVGKAWRDVFAPADSNDLYNVLVGLEKFTSGMIMSDKTADNLRRTLKGVFSIIHIISKVITTGISLAFKLLGATIGKADLNILSFTAAIGDALSALDKWLTSNNMFVRGFEKLGEAILAIGKVIKGLIKAFLEIPAVKTELEGFSNFWIGIFEIIKDASFDSLDSVIELLGKLKDRFEDINGPIASVAKSIGIDVFGGLADSIKTAVESPDKAINGFIESIKKLYSSITDGVSEVIKAPGDAFNNLKDIISKFVNYLKENVTLHDIYKVILGVTTIKLAMGTIKMVGALTNVLQGLSSVLGGLGNIFESVAGTFKSISNWMNAKALAEKSIAYRNMAISIAILAGSLYLISKIDSDKLWQSVTAIAALAAVMIVMSVAATKMPNTDIFGTAGTTMLAMAGAILLLSFALKNLSGINPKDALASAAILTALASAMVLISKIGGAVGSSVSLLSLIGMALTLKILVGLLDEISGKDLAKVLKSMGVMVLIMLGLGLVGRVSSGVKFTSALSMITMVVALKMVLSSLEDINDMKPEVISNSLRVVAEIFVMFGALMLATRVAGANAMKAGVGILMMTISLGMIVALIKLLGTIDQTTLDKAANTIVKIIAVLTVFLGVSKLAGKNALKAGAMLMMMSVSLALLVGVMIVLKNLSPEGMDRAMTVILLIGTMFAVLIRSTKNAGMATGTIVVLASVIAGLVGLVVLLTTLDQNEVMKSTGAMSILIVALSVMLKSMEQMGASTGSMGRIMASLGVILGVLGILTLIMLVIDDLEINTSIETISGLAMLLTSLAAACKIMSTIVTISKGALIGMALMTVIVAALGLIMKGLTELDIDVSLETVTGLSVMLIAMSTACLILSRIGPLAGAAAAGVLVLAELILVLGVLMVAVGALMEKFPMMEDFLDNGIVVLGKIGEGLGNFIGGIAGGILSGVANGILSGLPRLADTLSDFMDRLQPFIDKVKMVDSSAVDNALNVAKMIAALAGADILNSIAKFIGGGENSLVDFGTDLEKFATSIVNFSNALTANGGINSDAVDDAAAAGQVMSGLANNIPRSNGVFQFFAGAKDLGQFGTDLEKFATSIVNFSNVITSNGGISVDAANDAAAAGQVISGLADNIPRSNGVFQFFAGAKDLGQFGSDLELFGKSIVNFSNAITSNGGIDTEAANDAAAAGQVMSGLANNIPRSNGVFQMFAGSKDLWQFGEDLKDFGSAIVSFSNTLTNNGGIDGDAIEDAANAGSLMAGLVDKLPTTGGIFNIFTGVQDLWQFGEDLKDFGSAIVSFSNTLTNNGGIDGDAIESAANAGSVMAALADNLPDDGKIFGVFGDSDLVNFGEDLVEFGEAMSDFSDAVDGIVPDKVKTAVTAGKTLAELSDLPNLDEGFFSTDFTSFGDQLKYFGEGVSAFANAVVDMPMDGVKKAAGIGTSIAEMAKSVPTEKTGLFSDSTTLSTFNSDLEDYAEVIVSFASTVSSMPSTDIEAATKAGKGIAEMTRSIGSEGGIKTAIFGKDMSMDTFKTDVVGFAQAIVSFSEKTASLDSDALDRMKIVAAIGSKLGTTTKLISNSGWTENGALGSFVSNITIFAAGITKLSDMFNNTDVSNLNDDMSAVKTSLATLSSAVSLFVGDITDVFSTLDTTLEGASKSVGTMKSALTPLLDLMMSLPVDFNAVAFGNKLKYIAIALKVFMESISNLSIGDAHDNITKINEQLESLSTVANTNMEKFSGPFTTAAKTIATATDDISDDISTMATDSLGAINNNKTPMISAMTATINGMVNAISEKINSPANKLKVMMSNALSAVNCYVSKFYTVGENIATGLANGISADAYKAEAKARAMAKAAEAAAKEELDEHSPSKKFFKIGEFAVAGLSNALKDGTKDVYSSSSGLADMAIKGISSVVDQINSLVDSDIDNQPTIRPVLDLSNITNGATSINGLFGSPSLQIMSNLGNINTSMSRRIQNGSNNDVVSALKDLKKTIKSTSTGNYTINGITYDDGSNVSNAVKEIVRAARIERRM